MIPTLEQAVLTELAAAGPVSRELRLLAKDRAERARVALIHHGPVTPLLGGNRAKVASNVAARAREEHAAGVRVRT